MDVCLRTGHAGNDATGHLLDGSLMGALWCLPYLVVEPDLASVVVLDDDTPVGYVLGAIDSAAFGAAAEEVYWPGVCERHPIGSAPEGSLDELLVHLIHDRSHTAGSRIGSDLERRYPSHLHIDLLPEAQGQGFGRRLIDRLSTQLAERGSPGVHLGVSRANERAIAFYRHLGFTEWDGPDDGIDRTFVRDLSKG
ncbi:MAG: GNAT family N-acetyltransferase [Actinobacteria bacterium]|nr:GNAT family N-acetyltransferase [Actinomycetota bacterium]